MDEWIQIHLLQFVVSAVCLWRRMSEDLTPPACASLNTAQNCSKEPLPSPLPSSHPLPLENTAHAAGETVLRFCRRRKGLSSATPETTAPSQLAETRLGATAPAKPSCWAEPQRAPRHFTCCSLVPTSTTSLLATKADSSEWTRGHNVRFGGNFCSLFLPLTQSTRNCFLFHYVHNHHPQWVRPSHPLICPVMQRDFRCLPRPPATRLGCCKNSPA